jgi:hypothetical protein
MEEYFEEGVKEGQEERFMVARVEGYCNDMREGQEEGTDRGTWGWGLRRV